MNIKEQGRVIVNDLIEVYRSDKVLLLEIDLHTKNAGLFSYCTNGDGNIALWYEETEDSVYPDETKEIGSMTTVLLDYPGWIVYNVNHSRYTTYITLMKQEFTDGTV